MKEIKINKKIAERVKELAAIQSAHIMTINQLSVDKHKAYNEMWDLISKYHPEAVNNNMLYSRVRNTLIPGKENP